MSDQKKLAIIATKGSLDWAYPPFILASTAAALGYETQIFFTFYGLQLLRKKLHLEVTPLGNPGMPMPMGMDKWFPVLGTALPGYAEHDDRHDEEEDEGQRRCQHRRAA